MMLFTVKQIAAAIGISDREVQRRARKEAWEFKIETCRGGKKRKYHIDSLPDPIKIAILTHDSQTLVEATTTNSLPARRKCTLPAKKTDNNSIANLNRPPNQLSKASKPRSESPWINSPRPWQRPAL